MDHSIKDMYFPNDTNDVVLSVKDLYICLGIVGDFLSTLDMSYLAEKLYTMKIPMHDVSKVSTAIKKTTMNLYKIFESSELDTYYSRRKMSNTLTPIATTEFQREMTPSYNNNTPQQFSESSSILNMDEKKIPFEVPTNSYKRLFSSVELEANSLNFVNYHTISSIFCHDTIQNDPNSIQLSRGNDCRNSPHTSSIPCNEMNLSVVTDFYSLYGHKLRSTHPSKPYVNLNGTSSPHIDLLHFPNHLACQLNQSLDIKLFIEKRTKQEEQAHKKTSSNDLSKNCVYEKVTENSMFGKSYYPITTSFPEECVPYDSNFTTLFDSKYNPKGSGNQTSPDNAMIDKPNYEYANLLDLDLHEHHNERLNSYDSFQIPSELVSSDRSVSTMKPTFYFNDELSQSLLPPSFDESSHGQMSHLSFKSNNISHRVHSPNASNNHSPEFLTQPSLLMCNENILMQTTRDDSLDPNSHSRLDQKSPEFGFISLREYTHAKTFHDTHLSQDEIQWNSEYANGCIETFQKKKKTMLENPLPNILYPESSDSIYPIQLDDNTIIDSFNLKIIHDRHMTGFGFVKEFISKPGTLVAGRYRIEENIDEATFSKTYKSFDTILQKYVCMKVIRNDKDCVDQCLNEIQILRLLLKNNHDDRYHIGKEYALNSIESIGYRKNLYELSKHSKLEPSIYTMGTIQKIAYQILESLDYIHSLGIIHSDIKPENILMYDIKTKKIKVVDFGSSCFESDILPIYTQSRSYRAPEVVLGLPYDTQIDLWSLGCILAELWTGNVLFRSENHSSLLAKIVSIMGPLPYYLIEKGIKNSNLLTADNQIIETIQDTGSNQFQLNKKMRVLIPEKNSLENCLNTSDTEFICFIKQLLQIDACKRLNAKQALMSSWFSSNRYSDGL